MKKLLLLGILILLTLSLVSASLSIVINSDTHYSLNLNTGDSQDVQFMVNNEQYSCSLNCIWKLYDLTNSQTVDFGSVRAEPNTPFYKTFTLTAPTQGSGVVEYLFSVNCNEITGQGNPEICSGVNQGANDKTTRLVYSTPEVTCSPSWTCGVWSDCVNTIKARSCNDGCGKTKSESEYCCMPSWSCNQWSDANNECGVRTCNDLNGCGITTGKPQTSRYCPTKQGYPDYGIYHGHWEGGECIACEPIHFVDDKIDSNDIPILLVHGWGNSANLQNTQNKEWGDLQNKLEQLEEDGFDIWRLQYAPANLSNRKNAGVVAKAINEILNRGYSNQGVNKVYVVAHSMGGLAVRGYTQGMGIDEFGSSVPYENNIGKIVLTGSPQYGSYFANIIDGITQIDLPTEHPSCQEVVEGDIDYKHISSLAGNSEATLDLEFGSDFTWELNKNGLNQDIDFLTIAGKYPIGFLLLPAKDYCLHNNFEINDGVVSLISANLLKFDIPLAIFHEPHISLDGINKDDDVGFLIKLFFKEEMNYDSAYGNIFTGLNSLEGEIYYNPFESKKDDLPTKFTSRGSFILETHFSEVKISDSSLTLDGNIGLERNRNSGKWFYINIDSDASQKILDFTTMLPRGDYDLYVNEINTGENIDVPSGSVNLISFEFDKDSDNFDVENVGGHDCDDSRDLTYPGAFETCNSIDDNCYSDVEDDGINETWFNDSTGCGIGECKRAGNLLCITGKQKDTCIPGEPIILLNSMESKDSNCDGLIGEIDLDFERDNLTLKFGEENKTLLEFEFDVFNESLDVRNFSIIKQTNESFAYAIVKGLNLGNQTKTIYLDKIVNGTGLCLKDAEIQGVENITLTCDGQNEFWVSCPGVNEGYSCELVNNETQYKISGLKHSGVREQETYCGDGICNGGEACDVCSDCGACPVEIGGSSDGGGGGGGGSSSNVQQTTPQVNTSLITPNINNQRNHSNTKEKANETEENLERGFSFGMTGAVVGAKLNQYKFPLAFVILVAGAGSFILIRKRKKMKK